MAIAIRRPIRRPIPTARIVVLKPRPLHPAEKFALSLVLLALIFDAHLAKSGDELISSVVRQGVVSRILVLYFAAHLCFSIPHDPLTYLGNLAMKVLKPKTSF